jgi:hypothetical protein
VVFAGLRYREFLMEHLNQRWTVEVPLEGLGIGKQLQWLKRHKSSEESRMRTSTGGLQY